MVYGLLRTKDAVTPSLTTGDVLTSLIVYMVVYCAVVSFGIYYIYKLLREGPTERRHGQCAGRHRQSAAAHCTTPPATATGSRPEATP